MKILLVKKVLQTSNTNISELEYVEYYEEYNPVDCIMEVKMYIPTWCVRTDRTRSQLNLEKSNFEFIEWLREKELDIVRLNKKLEAENSDTRIEGIYLYDIGSCLQKMSDDVEAINFYPRYDYIRVKNKI